MLNPKGKALRRRWREEREAMLEIQKRGAANSKVTQKGLTFDPGYKTAHQSESYREQSAGHARRGWSDAEYREKRRAEQEKRSVVVRERKMQEAEARLAVRRKRQARKAQAEIVRAELMKDPEFRRKGEIMQQRFKGRSVRCVETGEVFTSAHKAAGAKGVLRVSITKCCLGQRNRAGGFHWEYAVEHQHDKEEGDLF